MNIFGASTWKTKNPNESELYWERSRTRGLHATIPCLALDPHHSYLRASQSSFYSTTEVWEKTTKLMAQRRQTTWQEKKIKKSNSSPMQEYSVAKRPETRSQILKFPTAERLVVYRPESPLSSTPDRRFLTWIIAQLFLLPDVRTFGRLPAWVAASITLTHFSGTTLFVQRPHDTIG
jgi:hypothetical protein